MGSNIRQAQGRLGDMNDLMEQGKGIGKKGHDQQLKWPNPDSPARLNSAKSVGLEFYKSIKFPEKPENVLILADYYDVLAPEKTFVQQSFRAEFPAGYPYAEINNVTTFK